MLSSEEALLRNVPAAGWGRWLAVLGFCAAIADDFVDCLPQVGQALISGFALPVSLWKLRTDCRKT